MAIFVQARNSLIVKVKVLQGMIDEKNASIFKLYSPYVIILETLFLLVHPNPWLLGYKFYLKNQHLDANYYYHVNDILMIAQWTKA